MSMYIQSMSSCAIQELVGLCEHKTPEEAMLQFCRKTLGSKGDCAPNGGYSAYYHPGDKTSETPNGNKGGYTDGLGENYIFHGVESYNYREPTSYSQLGYASRFAAFITENRLGNVYGGDPVKNHRYHPEHTTRVFVFNPDREAVKAWWAAHQPKTSIVLEEAGTVIEMAKKPKNPVPLVRQLLDDMVKTL